MEVYSEEGTLYSEHVLVPQVTADDSLYMYVVESGLQEDRHLIARVLFNSKEITQTNFCKSSMYPYHLSGIDVE